MAVQNFFGLIHKDESVARACSSGGAFSAISDKWFDLHGEKAVVYGAAFDGVLNVKHIRATDKKTRDLMRGSKYVQSDTAGVFNSVEKDLKTDLSVLFSGTPCQVAALKKYLKAKNISSKSLLTVEVICHGVGSNSFFESYVSALEKKYKAKAVSCNFRAKSRPGKLQDMKIDFENSKTYNSASAKYDWFFSAYSRNYILRESCFSCPFARPEREADISLGDNWGVETAKPSSLVISNTQVGLDLIKLLSDNAEIFELTFDDAVQPNLLAPSSKPNGYEDFWKAYESEGYFEAQKFLGNNTAKTKIKAMLAVIIYRLHLYSLIKKFIKILKNFR